MPDLVLALERVWNRTNESGVDLRLGKSEPHGRTLKLVKLSIRLSQSKMRSTRWCARVSQITALKCPLSTHSGRWPNVCSRSIADIPASSLGR